MIVMNVFADQYDNAARLVEANLGARLDPYNFKDEELLSLIEKVLGDEMLKERLQAAAKRIQMSNRHEEYVMKIEELMMTQKSKK